MLNKMSEAQRSMLQAAAACEDRLLQPPGNARGAVAKSLAAKLIDAGWAKEINASNGAPVWRREAGTGGAYALKLTAKGLKAVAASEGHDGSENSSLPTQKGLDFGREESVSVLAGDRRLGAREPEAPTIV
jgi:hypothetical protein